MATLADRCQQMNTATLALPTGAALEREIENIEAQSQSQSHDERIRKTIAERIAIANNPATVFVPHDDVFSASKARLLAKLSGKAIAS
jgi:hypothetical protein